VIAYGCLIKRKEARREHLDYIYRGLMTQHAKVHCDRKEVTTTSNMAMIVWTTKSHLPYCRCKQS